MNPKLPNTPFSTPLSGSARETELRLKNIFSGPKKRPPIPFLALVFSLCIFCGNLVSIQPVEAVPVNSDTPVLSETGFSLPSLTTKIADYFKRFIKLPQKGAEKTVSSEDKFDDQKEKDEKEWEEALLAEYQAVGVTIDGKNYYYQGQLVNIFLDIRSNGAFYALDTNPAGTVNIKILRSADNKITGVAYITESEVTELLNDLREDAVDEKEALKNVSKSAWTDGQKEAIKSAHKVAWSDDDRKQAASGNTQEIPVHLDAVAAGETVWLGEHALSEGDRIRYNISAETGPRLQIGFARPGDETLNTTYYSVNTLRKNGGILNCNADMTFRSPAKPGTYALFLCAPDGALGQVTGSISITAAKS